MFSGGTPAWILYTVLNPYPPPGFQISRCRRSSLRILAGEADGSTCCESIAPPQKMGVGGVLLAAKAQNHLAEIRPCLDGLRQIARFYLGEQVYQALLAAANEVPQANR
jgi:hypothetical protein